MLTCICRHDGMDLMPYQGCLDTQVQLQAHVHPFCLHCLRYTTTNLEDSTSEVGSYALDAISISATTNLCNALYVSVCRPKIKTPHHTVLEKRLMLKPYVTLPSLRHSIIHPVQKLLIMLRKPEEMPYAPNTANIEPDYIIGA